MSDSTRNRVRRIRDPGVGWARPGWELRRLAAVALVLTACVTAVSLAAAASLATAAAPGAAEIERSQTGPGNGAEAVPEIRPEADSEELDPFARNSLGAELGLAFYEEGWNFNGSREHVADVTVAFWWTVAPRVSVVLELHAARVFQETVRHAFVTGVAPIVRFQVLDRGTWDLFGEIGPGFSWSDTIVPAGGTRFNYLGIAGAGVSRRLGPRSRLTAGFRWLHLSNNDREGHDRNPDIQSLGAYGALMLGL